MALSVVDQYHGNRIVFDGAPSLRLCRDVIYVPVACRDHAQHINHGLYDQHHRVIPGSGRVVGPGNFQFSPSSFCNFKGFKSYKSENIFYYFGYISDHYGHFIIDCLGRLQSFIVLREKFPNIKLLFHGNMSVFRFFKIDFIKNILGAIGIQPFDFVSFDHTTKLSSVFVQAPAFEELNFCYTSFFDFGRFVGERVQDFYGIAHSAGTISFEKPIYISKSKLNYGVSKLINEVLFEEKLSMEGFEIIHPETLPFKEQIRLFSQNSVLCGFVGSAFHTSLFCHPKQMITISYDKLMWTNQVLIDKGCNNRSLYVWSDLIESIGGDNFFGNRFNITDVDKFFDDFMETYTNFKNIRIEQDQVLMAGKEFYIGIDGSRTHAHTLTVEDNIDFLKDFDAMKYLEKTSQPLYRSSIAACARWESRYIVEWLTYYQTLGFDHVFLYCNDDNPLPLFRLVEPFTRGDTPFVTFRHHAEQGQQREMYLDFLKQYAHQSEWFGFLDIDEFIRIPPSQTIGQFLAGLPADSDAVLFNWVFFGPNGHKTPPDVPVLQAFTRRQAYLHQNTKFLMRASALTSVTADFDHGDHPFWHRPNPLLREGARIVNVLGEPANDYYEGFPDAPLKFINEDGRRERIFETALIHHYAFRSEQAFAERAARGTLGSFAGQGMWKELAEGTGFEGFLAAINGVEDVSLARFWDQGSPAASALKKMNDQIADDDRLGANLLSLNRPATQSSLSAWSRGQTTEQDAQGAVNGVIDGRAGFHTAFESQPWWRVDLEQDCAISGIRIFNRLDQPDTAIRSARLAIDVGRDPSDLVEIYRRDSDQAFGGVDGRPLIVPFDPPIHGRLVRVRLLEANFLHLDQIQIFGAPEAGGEAKSAPIPEIAARDPIDQMSERDVLERFQSIGNNCEFGSVQKSLGIGRLSLLQWTASQPQSLTRAIHDDFAVLVNRSDIVVTERQSEYFWRDPEYNLESHSFIRVSEMSREDFVKTIRARNRFLVRKFLEELEEGGHIFVYNFFGEPLPTLDVLSELAAILSRRAPNYLLAVGLPSDACSEENKVFHWQSGLILATKDAHTSFDSTPAEYRPGWLSICRDTLRLLRERDPAFWTAHTERVAALQADMPPVQFAPGNLCQGKKATQSSLSPYSIGRTLEEDAAGAINGRIDGQIKFHTDIEDSPWWQVDLGAMFGVSQVKIYNRMDVPGVMARAAHLAIEVGFRGDDWVEIYRRESPEPFGGIDGNPLVFAPTIPVPARFVRVRLLRRAYLHLDQVEVFGEKLSASIAKNLDRFVDQQPKFVSNDLDNRELFSNFISLGLNCEFGIVQKLSGLTKLGLLDWCATPVESVLEMLRSNFDGVGNPEQTKIAVKGDDYDVFDTRYNFAGHSFVNPNDISADVFYQQITQRLKFLRRKMIEELEIGEAIFIYKMNGNPVDPRLIRNVAIEIKRYGNGALLSVCDAAVTGCPSGHVRWLGGNLFEGHLDHMADLAEAGSVSLPHWRELCLNALELISAVRADGEFLNRNATPNTGVAGYWHRDQLNIASGKFAAQSSVSPWSHGSTTVDEALGCLIGAPNGRANCHTAYDAHPWWMVDLGQNFAISSIVIFNRVDEQEIMKRSSHLAVEVATDTDAFREIYRRDVDEPFGGIDGQPLIIASDVPIRARFVLIRLLAENFLHLDKVEIYGTPSHPV